MILRSFCWLFCCLHELLSKCWWWQKGCYLLLLWYPTIITFIISLNWFSFTGLDSFGLNMWSKPCLSSLSLLPSNTYPICLFNLQLVSLSDIILWFHSSTSSHHFHYFFTWDQTKIFHWINIWNYWIMRVHSHLITNMTSEYIPITKLYHLHLSTISHYHHSM